MATASPSRCGGQHEAKTLSDSLQEKGSEEQDALIKPAQTGSISSHQAQPNDLSSPQHLSNEDWRTAIAEVIVNDPIDHGWTEKKVNILIGITIKYGLFLCILSINLWPYS